VKWLKNICVFHDWSKWEQYRESGIVYNGLLSRALPPEGQRYIDNRQRRTCKKCGKMQDVLV
jgi:hypothetical protein